MNKIEITIKLPDNASDETEQPIALELFSPLLHLAYWAFWLFLAYHSSILVIIVPFCLSVFHNLAKGYCSTRYR